MKTKVSLELSAIDRASSVIGKIGSKLRDLWGSVAKKIDVWLSKSFDIAKTWAIGLWTAWVGAFTGIMVDVIGADKVFKNFQSQVWATEKEMLWFKWSIKDVFSAWYWEDLKQVSDLMAQITRETWKTWSELTNSTKRVLTLSQTFWKDQTQTFNAIQQVSREFWISFWDVSDMIMKWFQSSWDASDDFLESLYDYKGNFREMWYDAKQFMNFLINWSKAWAKNIDQVWDIWREFSIKLKEWSKSQVEELKKMGISYKEEMAKINNWTQTQADYMNLVINKIKQIKDVTQRWNVIANLFWTQWDDNTAKFVTSLVDAKDNIWNFQWSTAQAAKNIESSYETIFRRLRVSFMQVWEVFMPQLEKLTQWFVNNPWVVDQFAKSIADFVSNSIPRVQEFIASFDFKSVLDSVNQVIWAIQTVTETVWGWIWYVRTWISWISETAKRTFSTEEWYAQRLQLDILEKAWVNTQNVSDLSKFWLRKQDLTLENNLVRMRADVAGKWNVYGTDALMQRIQRSEWYKEEMAKWNITVNVNMNNNIVKGIDDVKKMGQQLWEIASRNIELNVKGVK